MEIQFTGWLVVKLIAIASDGEIKGVLFKTRNHNLQYYTIIIFRKTIFILSNSKYYVRNEFLINVKCNIGISPPYSRRYNALKYVY